jgi:hypothetical protein
VITGEFGEDDCSASYIDQYMQWADQNNVSYLAWSWNTPNPGESCASANLNLVSSLAGAPSTISPSGHAYAAHLAALATSVP